MKTVPPYDGPGVSGEEALGNILDAFGIDEADVMKVEKAGQHATEGAAEYLVVDGVKIKKYGRIAGRTVTFSPDGAWAAYVANNTNGERWKVAVNGVEATPTYDLVREENGLTFVGPNSILFGTRIAESSKTLVMHKSLVFCWVWHESSCMIRRGADRIVRTAMVTACGPPVQLWRVVLGLPFRPRTFAD